MGRLGRRKFNWPVVAPTVVGGVVICVGLGLLIVWGQWTQTPSPRTSTHQIGADGSARGQVTWELKPGGRPSRPDFSYVHHLEFASSGGPVQVCVVPCNLSSRKQDADDINERTAEFAAGQVPKDTVAQASGVRGRIDLHHLPRSAKNHSFLVFFRGASGTDVTLVAHYWPW